MSQVVKLLVARLVRAEKGQDLVEYAVLVALIALIAAGGVEIFGGELETWFTNLGEAIPIV